MSAIQLMETLMHISNVGWLVVTVALVLPAPARAQSPSPDETTSVTTHSMYLRNADLAQAKQDIAAFIRSAVPKP